MLRDEVHLCRNAEIYVGGHDHIYITNLIWTERNHLQQQLLTPLVHLFNLWWKAKLFFLLYCLSGLSDLQNWPEPFALTTLLSPSSPCDPSISSTTNNDDHNHQDYYNHQDHDNNYYYHHHHHHHHHLDVFNHNYHHNHHHLDASNHDNDDDCKGDWKLGLARTSRRF